MSATPSAQKAEKQRAYPVPTLDNDIARLYTHIHPIVVLSGYFLSLQYVIADPVSSLFSLLVPLSGLQVAYVVLCLPPTGSPSSTSGQKSTPSKAGSQKKPAKSKQDVGIASRMSSAILSLILSVAIGTPLLTIILILFGAPLTTHFPHTLLCAAHLSLLTALPLVYAHGVSTEKWRSIAALNIPIDEVFGAAVGACLGAWFGAVPIPLDWDREWQKWPVTIITGAYIGWAVGKSAGGLLLKGKTINLSP